MINKMLRKLALKDNVYYSDHARRLRGKWPLSRRLAGLEPLLARANGRTVLDIGCAEGLISEAFLRAGASVVHGFDISPQRVAKAQRLLRDPRVRLEIADVSNCREFEAILDAKYDIVLFLGVFQHLKKIIRRQSEYWSLELTNCW
jgi:2-polyprenyl-3-methyl-5-hydroxy-6-metoxy-1,4-benzoquinol methylase